MDILTIRDVAKGYKRPFRRSYVHQKCGTVTTMSEGLAVNLAKDPASVTEVPCTLCNGEFPVTEFRWASSTAKVGS